MDIEKIKELATSLKALKAQRLENSQRSKQIDEEIETLKKEREALQEQDLRISNSMYDLEGEILTSAAE